MKIKKRFLTFFVLVVCFFVLSADSSFAADVKANNLSNAFKNVNSLAGSEGAGYNTSVNLESIIGTIIQTFLSLLGVIFLILIIYGGYLWMTDRGSEQEVNKAKKIIQYAVIGLIIVLSAYAISYFVLSSLTKSTLANDLLGENNNSDYAPGPGWDESGNPEEDSQGDAYRTDGAAG
jgi:hypothetical protein